jgi:hypothetical protein
MTVFAGMLIDAVNIPPHLLHLEVHILYSHAQTGGEQGIVHQPVPPITGLAAPGLATHLVPHEHTCKA